jgi:hypothetical protein
LRRNGEFEARKLRLVSVRHLLKEHQDLHPGRRADLIQSILGGDFNGAQRFLPAEEKSPTVFGLVTTAFGSLLTYPSDEPLKSEMKVISARLSDSRFLLELKDVDDKDLRSVIQEIEALAHSLLSSLIDKTIGNMTHEILAMQQEHCRRAIRDQLKSEATKRQNELLVNLIHVLNAQSARRRDS